MSDHERNAPARFEEDESTIMVPTFSLGSFFADRYRIEMLLGSGAMGRVYAATEIQSERRVALKVLHRERLGEEETVERFKREAEVLASIGHPSIVEIYTFHHTQDGTPYLAMELLEGVTLKTRLRNAGRFEDPREFQPVLDGICGALTAAHVRGIVHRDMKPDNVFLPATGTPRSKLVDFGLSRIAKADKSLTHSGMILGTPRYMAPEQIRDASGSGPPGDIYSLGVLIYESLSGQSPYPAQDYGQLLGCVLETRTTPFAEVRPDLPPALGQVLARAMAADPAQRFESCEALAHAYAAAVGVPSGIVVGPSTRESRPQKRARVPSITSLPMGGNKGSTLAFDVSAMGLPDLDQAPPLAGPSHTADPGASLGEAADLWATNAEPTRPDGDGAASGPAAHSHSPEAFAGTLDGGVPSPLYSQPPPEAPAALPAQGGDTLFLGDINEQIAAARPASGMNQPAVGMSQRPAPMVPDTRMQASVSPGDAQDYMQRSYGGVPGSQPGLATPSPYGSDPRGAAPPAKKSRLGFVLFIVAAFLVAALSAAGGLGLRAHMRGELDLPFTIPGVSPAAAE